MIGGIGPQVWDLVQQWTPSETYDHERKYQAELQEYLDGQLNEGSSMGLGMGGQRNYAVSTERGTARGDVVVNDTVGIELKRNFSNNQKRKLRGQLEDYGDNYDFVIACACGVEDTDGWREVQNKFTGNQRGMFDMTEFRFIIKRREDFGKRRDGDGDGLFGSGSLF
ncbi:hypothetical protein [Haloplanus sp. C73]|uniref:hypothetical protein n=1 Tax=Haloplanus sp. C73 TaxID=3421641 RepID=UPI003EB7B2BB